MKLRYSICMIISCFCFNCTKATAQALVLLSAGTERHITTQYHSCLDKADAKKVQKIRKGEKAKNRSFKISRKSAIILAIVLFSIGTIVLGGLGLIYLIIAFEFIGDSLALIVLLLGINSLALGILCLVGLIRQIKKLKKLNRDELPDSSRRLN